MKALAAVVITVFVLSVATASLLLATEPSAWWRVPAALASVAGTVVALVAIMLPREWWRG